MNRIMLMLPSVGTVVDTLLKPTEDQKEAFMYHLQCQMAMLGACVSAKLVAKVPDDYHDQYLRQIGKKIVDNTEWYMNIVAPLGYIPTEVRKRILEALKEEVQKTTRNAQREPKEFSDWHTVTQL